MKPTPEVRDQHESGNDRFVQCRCCGFVASFMASELLRTSMPCPRCRAENQFGPGVYNREFRGLTWSELK